MSAAMEQPASNLPMATWQRDRGWRPFPLDHPALTSCAGLHNPDRNPCDGKRGKHPVVKFGTACNVEPADGLLVTWFGRAPRNIGIACGPSGLLVVDEDELDALTKFASDRGHELPITYRVRTARGWHWYFDATDHPELGNSAGLLGDHGMDVRGAGGFVVAAGSVHMSGHIYEAEDEHVVPASLPEWLALALRTRVSDDGEEVVHEAGRWNDAVRYGTEVELRAQYRRRVDGIRSKGNAFRTDELFPAARDGWRLVNLGLLDVTEMGQDLREAVVRVWGNEPDERDRLIVNEEAREAALRSPWALTNVRKLGKDPAGGLADSEDEDDEGPDAYELEVLHEIRRQDVREEAARRRAARKRAGQPSIASELIDVRDLVSVQPPRMLMGELIPAASVGFLNGRTGTYKSFVAVSWACSLATGKAWQGRSEFDVPEPVRVLYVAAEGAAGVAQRVISWEMLHGQIPSGQLVVYPKPIKLNDELAVAELSDLIAERGFDVVFVDTLHRSASGMEEQSNTEFGMVYEAVAGLRDEHGTTTILVDHTGHRGGVIGRGASSKGDDADFVLGIEREGDIPLPEFQRTLKVAKRKDMPTVGEWDIRLRVVEGAPAAVLELGEVGSADSPFGMRNVEWWQHEVEQPLPGPVAALSGPGADAAREVYRVLRFVDDDNGMTISELMRALKQRPSGVPFSESTVRRGVRLLGEAGAALPNGAKWALDPSVSS